MSDLTPREVAYKALEDARAKIDLADSEKRDLTVDERTFVDAALKGVEDAEAAALKSDTEAKKAKIQSVFAAANEAREDAIREAGTPKGVQVPESVKDAKTLHGAESPEYAKAFDAWVRGDNSVKSYLEAEAKADGAVGAGATGGFLVPTPIWNELWVDTSAGYPMLDAVTTYNFTGTQLLIDQAFSHGSFAIVSEAGTPSAADEAYTQGTITAYKYQRLSKISDESITDPQFDVVSHLTSIMVRLAAEKENSELTIGSGSSAPTGVITGVYATSGQRVTGATGQATSIGADDVFTVTHRVKPQYRRSATWLANDDSIRILRTLKDANGNYLWVQGLSSDAPSQLAGRPVMENPDVATMAANAKSLCLVDLSGEVRAIPNGGQMQVLRLNELYAGTGQVGFRGTRRFGAGFMAPTTSGAIWVNAAA